MNDAVDASDGHRSRPAEPGRPNPGARAATGRPPTTTRQELERVALGLFLAKGFDRTTVDDIAEAAGIGRRTFFRYWASKNDVVWGDFDIVLTRMRARLEAAPPDEPMMEAVRHAVVAANRFDEEDLDDFRARITLITSVSTLQSHSMVRYAEWRQVLAEFVADRLGQRPTDLVPQAVGHAALGVALAACRVWATSDDGRALSEVLDEALRHLAAGFADVPGG